MADLLGIGISGLLAFQRGLATTSHNISNVNTEGYSRQSVSYGTRMPHPSPGGWMGTGVNVTSINRIMDETRNNSVRTNQSEFHELKAYADLGARLDNLVADKNAGLAPAMQGLFDAMQQVTTDPTSISAREIVIAEADNLAARFAFFENRFSELDQDINRNIEVQIREVNEFAGEIARLNKEIQMLEGRPGGPPNDLLDKRDHALSELSKRVGVSSVIQSDGTMNVFIGSGQALVVGHSAFELTTVEPAVHNPDDPSRVEIGIVRGNGDPINITRHLTGGSISGLLDFRENILDPEREELRRLAETIHDTFNEAHSQGYDLDGNPGGDFFAMEGGRLVVALDDARQLAAAGSLDPNGDPQVGDNENMLAMIELANERHDELGNASYQDFYASLVGRVGTQTMRANMNMDAQQVLLNQAIAAREEVSGVNLEEEAANLMRLQQSYHAAAQSIAVADTLFQSLLDAVRR
ncbi:flagellar hook-associated protein FlgK [Alkalilimnicola ehrlichii]|uniref:Flagellar hook-associated protein 1 n=1 Tax=Alkalilimnicola ehrlichii TaxID=351052 RepID=A0A3E0WRW8_9GAMM|nr:flagellar hook-associated protein FlgK [Alkalilimnicola ehrlichii]RFA28556.1 flagellar hook-associated protein FlgK [Alkalilimnicola ehrlichii]RFA35720.1 flagellar hook-associated protein FlgK [Alkalilimnicola ehrlichii]